MKKRRVIMLLTIITILLVGFIFLMSIGYELKLNGDSIIQVDVKSTYNDLGYSASFFNSDISNQVKVESNVDTSKIGEYEVKYTLKKIFYSKILTRKVIIKDKTSPVISLNGNNKVVLKVGEKYNESGVSAIDNYDGDITEKVEIEGLVNTNKAGSYEVTYKIVDSSGNEASIVRTILVEDKYTGGYVNVVEGPTYIDGILIVNKKYSLPSTYGGTDATALAALKSLQAAGQSKGFKLGLVSGYRSYQTQKNIYNRYVERWGIEYTDTISARPGHSEHQTGLAFDVGELTSSYGETKEGIWLKENCHKYGFIIRYLKGKEDITGYSYEPWHIRYVGVEVATYIMENDLTLEEYLGV